MTTRIPGLAVGMVGGGQLARMSAGPATALGIDFAVLAASTHDCAAAVVRHTLIGAHDDPRALAALAEGGRVVTFDHEHVPTDYLRELQQAGVLVRPGPDALAHAQDKALMRRAITDLGLPSPAWAVVGQRHEVAAFGDEHGWPVVLKVSRGGYDGRGVWIVESVANAESVMADVSPIPGAVWLVEEFLRFDCEIAAQVARSPQGQAVAYPVVQTRQIAGMCAEVIAPAPDLSDDQAIAAVEMALVIARELNVIGMLAVEMFVVDGALFINELAMRPHNSGHWSIDGARTSQFENHLRAVLDLPLGDPRMTASHAVMVNVVGPPQPVPPLQDAFRHVLARDPGLRIHLYGKEIRPARKLGHVTVVGQDLPELLHRAHHAADYMMGIVDE